MSLMAEGVGSDTQTTLAGLVGEAVGPLPRVCPEHVLRDLERARMMAEDLRELERVRQMAAAAITSITTISNLLSDQNNRNAIIVNIVRGADGGTAQDQEDALAQIRLELHMDNEEDEGEEDDNEEEDDEDDIPFDDEFVPWVNAEVSDSRSTNGTSSSSSSSSDFSSSDSSSSDSGSS